MFKMKKRCTAFAIASVLTMSLSSGVLAAESKVSNAKIYANGEIVAFEEESPIIVDNYIYVPLSSLSADTSSAVRENNAVLTENGIEYAKLRTVCELMNSKIAWDSQNRSVQILDLEELTADFSNSFSIMDRYMKYGQELSANPLSIYADYTMALSLFENGQAYPISVTGNMTGLTENNGGNIDMSIQLNMDNIRALLAATGEEPDAATMEQLQAFADTNISAILNMEEGTYYLSSPLFTSIFGAEENTWFSLNFDQLFEQAGLSGFSFSDLAKLSLNGSYSDILKTTVSSLPAETASDIKSVLEVVNVYKQMYGDDAFQKTASGYQSTYSVKEAGVNMTMVISLLADSSDQINGFSMDMNMDMGSSGSMAFTMSMTPDLALACNMAVEIPSVTKLTFDMNGKYAETSEKPITSPSAGSTIVNLMDLLA